MSRSAKATAPRSGAAARLIHPPSTLRAPAAPSGCLRAGPGRHPHGAARCAGAHGRPSAWGGAGIDADGQAVGAILRLDLAGEFDRQGPERRRLVRSQAEQVRLVAARDDEGVALDKRAVSYTHLTLPTIYSV